MKTICSVLFAVILVFVFSCKKTSFITSKDASVYFSADTLHFDTVFTTTGSITQLVKIFNQNDQKLRLNNIQLRGGNTSAFRLNVDGTPGTNFTNIELEANDSIYVFVTVTINPSAINQPFIVRDSVLVSYNGNDKFIQLEAYGQNAHFLRGNTLSSNSFWQNDLPYIILDSITINPGVKLTIDSGCRIYSHANAPFIVNGSLQVNGDSTARVTFAGDRLDPDYRDLPGSWPGIFFSNTSTDNVLNYTTIKNGYQGIITEGETNNKITLNQCKIENIFDAGILAYNSSIKAINCLISNCGRNISINAGGNYSFDFCTVVTIGSFYIQHKNPVLFITDADENNMSQSTTATFTNSIFYGDAGITEDEVIVAVLNSSSLQPVFKNCIYRNKSDKASSFFDTSSLNNIDPEFEEIDAGKGIFNFHLKETSLAVDAGNNIGPIIIDLDGKPRPDLVSSIPADIGCYERQ